MKYLAGLALVAVLALLVYQKPTATYVTRLGFACTTPDMWEQYNKAINTSNSSTIRNIRLAQRCVDLAKGEVKVISRAPGFLLIEANAGRKLYIPKAYVIE